VRLDIRIAAIDKRTQGFTGAAKASKSKQHGNVFGHLDLGATPTVWQKIQPVLDR
jgi:hypothetical protein